VSLTPWKRYDGKIFITGQSIGPVFSWEYNRLGKSRFFAFFTCRTLTNIGYKRRRKCPQVMIVVHRPLGFPDF